MDGLAPVVVSDVEALAQGSDLRRRLRAGADGMAENSWDNVAFLDRELGT